MKKQNGSRTSNPTRGLWEKILGGGGSGGGGNRG
jgi:hypothetical protein